MSRHNHSAIAQEIAYIVNEIDQLTLREIKTIYGIDLLSGKKVYDPMYGKTFESVSEWAEFNIKQDDIQYEEHFNDKNKDEFQ